MVRNMIILVAAAMTAMGGTAGATVSPSPPAPPASSPASSPAVSQQDRDFLVQAHQANLTEIESSKTARKKTEGRMVRSSTRPSVSWRRSSSKTTRSSTWPSGR